MRDSRKINFAKDEPQTLAKFRLSTPTNTTKKEEERKGDHEISRPKTQTPLHTNTFWSATLHHTLDYPPEIVFQQWYSRWRRNDYWSDRTKISNKICKLKTYNTQSYKNARKTTTTILKRQFPTTETHKHRQILKHQIRHAVHKYLICKQDIYHWLYRDTLRTQDFCHIRHDQLIINMNISSSTWSTIYKWPWSSHNQSDQLKLDLISS